MPPSQANSKKPVPFLDTLVFEIRYAYGHTYLDRCGQTLVDIEQGMPSWMSAETTPNNGQLQDHTNGFAANFGPSKFDFTAFAANTKKIETIATTAHSLWDIVKNNLGLSAYIRVGCRFRFLLAKRSLTETELGLSKSSFNIQLPESLQNGTYKPVVRQPMAVLASDQGVEYRVEMQSVIRQVNIAPTVLETTNPRLLSNNQRQAQLALLRQRASLGSSQINANLPNAIMLDVDCAQYENINAIPRSFITEQYEVVTRDFLPILRAL